jgi:HD domain
MHGIGFCGLIASTPHFLGLHPRALPHERMRTTVGSAPLPSRVAGIRVVDSDIAQKATQLARESSSPYLFNHAVRTFIFASLTGRAIKQHYNEERLFLACILHDLGLTDRFQGDLPFEIQGAEAAKQFLEANSYSKEGIETIWDGIAMHASPIAQFKCPEIALVAEGAGADVLGADPAQISKSAVDEIMNTFPRLGFKSAFVTTCANVVRKHPRGASRGFMRDIGERYVAEFRPKNFCDLLTQAPYSE